MDIKNGDIQLNVSIFFIFYVWLSLIFFVWSLKDNAGCTNREEGTAFDDTPLARWNLNIFNECTSIAVVVAQDILQSTLLVTAYIDGTVV